MARQSGSNKSDRKVSDTKTPTPQPVATRLTLPPNCKDVTAREMGKMRVVVGMSPKGK